MAETVRIEIPIETIDRTDAGIKSAESKISNLEKVAKNTENSVKKANETVSKFDQSSEKTHRALSSWAKEKYQMLLEAKEQVSPVLEKIKSGVGTFSGKAFSLTMKAVDMATAPIRGVIDLLKNPILQAGAVLSVTIGFKDTIDTYAGFESAMSQVKAISGATEKEFEQLTAKAKEMGASTKFTAQESANAFNYMGMAGWKTKDMLDGIEGIMNLAAASGEDLATTSDIVTDALTAFKLKASDSAHFADVLAQASASANTNVGMMGETFKYVAPVAGALGYSIEDTSLAIGLMANSGIKSSQAGTALRGMLTRLVKPSEEAADALSAIGVMVDETATVFDQSKIDKQVEKVSKASLSAEKAQSAYNKAVSKYGQNSEEAGFKLKDLNLKLQSLGTEQDKLNMLQAGSVETVNSYNGAILNSDGSMKSLKETLTILRGKFKGLSESEQAQYAASIAGQEAMSGFLALMNASDEDFDKLSDSIENCNGKTKEMSDTMLDNLAGSFTLFQSAVDGAKIELGERFAPYVKDFVDFLTAHVPDAQETIIRLFKNIEQKAKDIKGTFSEIMGTKEWEKADLFGKIEIAWDKIIAEPFSNWWDTKGKTWLARKAGSIGNGIGTAISDGLLALLGIDIGKGVDEGTSIGASFANGFVRGFDVEALKDKIWDALKGIFSNASKVFTGDADLTSWVSAAGIAKVVAPLLGAGLKGAKILKTILGSSSGSNNNHVGGSNSGGTTSGETAGTVGETISSAGETAGTVGETISSAGEAVDTGSGLLGFGKNLALKLGASSSLSGGMLSTIGLGSAAGGIAGGATIISGGMDLYRGFKAQDEEEANAYINSGGWKIGGVAGGAATGAAIGGAFGGIGAIPGALIGGGIGGIMGWIKGDEIKAEYEESLKEAQEATKKFRLEQEQAKYKSQELKDALADTGMTAEEFGEKFEAAVTQDLERHFGDIKLRVTEIEEIAKSITFADNLESIKTFSDATDKVKEDLLNVQNATRSLEKLEWKAGLGFKFDEGGIAEFQQTVDTYISSAKTYVEDKQYEFTTAVSLLIDVDSDQTGILDSANAMYANMKEQLNSLGAQLKDKVNIALADGVITMDEQAEISNLQQQIADITNSLSDAETEASFEAIKIKFSGADLDYDSFVELQNELQKQVQEATESYDEALEVSISNLLLELEKGAISKEQYDEQLQKLMEGYQGKVSDLKVRVENMQLEAIAESYSRELENILPGIEGTTAEKLGWALHNAMNNGVDISSWKWDYESAAKWLGIENLSEETKQAIGQMMGKLGETLPRDLKDTLQKGTENLDYSGVNSSLTAGLLSSVANLNLDPIGGSITLGLLSAMYGMDLSQTGAVINGKLGGSVLENTGPLSDSLANMASNAEQWLNGFFAPVGSTAALPVIPNVMNGMLVNTPVVDTSVLEVANRTENNLNTNFAPVGSVAANPVAPNVSTSMLNNSGILDTSALELSNKTNNNLISYFLPVGSTAGDPVPRNVSDRIASKASDVQAGCNKVKDEATNHLIHIFKDPINVSPLIQLSAQYRLTNPPNLAAMIPGNASGGFVSGKQLSWVGEEGPEAIIPLIPSRRERALELYAQVGEMLGIGKFANGGIIGNSSPVYNEGIKYISSIDMKQPDGNNEFTEHIPIQTPASNYREKTEVKIEVTVSPKFEISGDGNEENILRVLKSHLQEIADELGGEIAEKLEDVFSNMPLKEA